MEEEMQLLSDMVDDYPYVAFDTEFPGTLVRSLDRSEDGEYKAVKYVPLPRLDAETKGHLLRGGVARDDLATSAGRLFYS